MFFSYFYSQVKRPRVFTLSFINREFREFSEKNLSNLIPRNFFEFALTNFVARKSGLLLPGGRLPNPMRDSGRMTIEKKHLTLLQQNSTVKEIQKRYRDRQSGIISIKCKPSKLKKNCP